jgi:choline dehydrogenase-like flavoprotein
MLIDGRSVLPGTVISCGVCIVGAGAAGITAALELEQRGVDVVLLEAGGRRHDPAMQEALAGEVELPASGDGPQLGSVHPALDVVRQRRLGGTTGSWGGRCRPLDAIDFETRDYLANSGWPLGPDELEPYYRRANVYCDAGAFEYTSRTALPNAPDFLLESGWRSRLTDSELLRYSRPTDFGKAYGERIAHSRRLRVLHHAFVLRLEGSPEGTSVRSAVVASLPGREFTVEAAFFIAAGGGLETTRLLLVSARQARGSLAHGEEFLGHFYMTHLDGFVGRLRFASPPPRAAFSYELSWDGVYCRRLICLAENTLRSEGLLNFSSVLFMPPPEDPSHGDGLLSAFALAKQALFRAKIGFKSRRHGLRHPPRFDTRAHLQNVLRNPWRLPGFGVAWASKRWLASRRVPSFLTASRSWEYRFLFSAEQSPLYRNSVTLGSALDRFGVPRLAVRWDVARGDHESIVRALQIIAQEFNRLGLGTAEIPATPEELQMAIGGGFLGGTHAMGTTRMAASPRAGVVDRECRMHGVRNLFIASSSVFPTGGFAAPTLTIVALAIRIADTVGGSFRNSRPARTVEWPV